MEVVAGRHHVNRWDDLWRTRRGAAVGVRVLDLQRSCSACPLRPRRLVRTVGKQITLRVNGAVVNEFNDAEVLSGYLGLDAEGYNVEYRNVRLKKL